MTEGVPVTTGVLEGDEATRVGERDRTVGRVKADSNCGCISHGAGFEDGSASRFFWIDGSDVLVRP